MMRYSLEERKRRLTVARALDEELTRFLAPLVEWLDTLLDKRLVRTLVASIVALLEWRNRAHGLLLERVGSVYLRSGACPRRDETPLQPAALAQVGGQRD